MSSSLERAGRDLLKIWNDSSIEIQVALTGGGVIGFRLEGKVEGLAAGKLHVIGAKCDCVLDLSDANFVDVVTEEGLKQLGLSPEAYSRNNNRFHCAIRKTNFDCPATLAGRSTI